MEWTQQADGLRVRIPERAHRLRNTRFHSVWTSPKRSVLAVRVTYSLGDAVNIFVSRIPMTAMEILR